MNVKIRSIRLMVGALAIISLAVAGVAAQDQEAPVDVTGKWRMSLDMSMGRATPMLELQQNEGKLSGTYTGRYGSSPVSGEIDGRSLKFGVAMETMTLRFRGELLADGTLKGTADFGDMGAASWTAAREQ